MIRQLCPQEQGWVPASRVAGPASATQGAQLPQATDTQGHKEEKVTAARQGWPTAEVVIPPPPTPAHMTITGPHSPSRGLLPYLSPGFLLPWGPGMASEVSEPHGACKFSSAALVSQVTSLSGSGPEDAELILVLIPCSLGLPGHSSLAGTLGGPVDGAPSGAGAEAHPGGRQGRFNPRSGAF